jgi:hypothetical protein
VSSHCQFFLIASTHVSLKSFLVLFDFLGTDALGSPAYFRGSIKTKSSDQRHGSMRSLVRQDAHRSPFHHNYSEKLTGDPYPRICERHLLLWWGPLLIVLRQKILLTPRSWPTSF